MFSWNTYLNRNTGQHLSFYSQQSKDRNDCRGSLLLRTILLHLKGKKQNHRNLLKLLLFCQNPELWPPQHLILRMVARMLDFQTWRLTTVYLWAIFKDKFIDVNSYVPVEWVISLSSLSIPKIPLLPQLRNLQKKHICLFDKLLKINQN